jgi:Na+-transporting methylmalonyl-CoA/oxaloacetate decarboxylase gamma subunit
MHSLTALPAPRLLGYLPEYPSLSESVPFQLTGLAVVFIALGLIWLALKVMGLYFTRQAPAVAPVPVASLPPAAAPAPAVPADLAPELVAVIAATVQVTLEGPYRIQAIVPVNPGQDWAHEGRRQIFASHQIR